MNPKECRYTKEHEWVRMEGNVAVVGITDYAQSQLGDIVYVELPPVGETLELMKPFGVVESVKAASDLYAPLNGKVLEANADLAVHPELVNQDPYGKGWMLRMNPANASEMSALMTAEDYEKYLEGLH